MRHVLLLVMIIAPAFIAGCATPGGATSPAFTLNRQIRFHLDAANIDADDDDPYKYVSSAFIVRIGEAAVVPSTVSITYQDKEGVTVTKALSNFTDLLSLAPGAEVRVEDVNITSDAQLLLNGVTVLTRSRDATPWWNANGYPLGFSMEPGSRLAYKVTGDAKEAFEITNVEPESPEMPVLDSAKASFGMAYEGTLDLTFESALREVKSAVTSQARPLGWSMAGTMTFPLSAEVAARDPSKGETYTAGGETLPGTTASFDATGRVFWNESNGAIRQETDGGNGSITLDVIAWQTGAFPGAEEFSCAGKTKADKCHPTEIPGNGETKTEAIPAYSENLDNFPWDVEPEVVANITRFLAEDLVPGDEFRFDVDLDSAEMKDWTVSPGQPSSMHLVGGASMRAVNYESVTVAAGTFDALKIVERVDFALTLGEARDAAGKVVFKPFHTEQRLMDTTFWLEKATFTPLRVEQSMPLQFGPIVDQLIAAVDGEAWKQSQIKPLGPENVEFTVEGRMAFELTKHEGTSRFSPWVVLAGFHTVGAVPALIGMRSTSLMGPAFGTAYPTTPYYENEERPRPAPTPPTWEYADDYGGSGDYATSARSLSITSGGAITGDTKEYVIASASEGLNYNDLAFQLDEVMLDYGPGDSTWCVVVAGECDMDAAYADVAAGDTIRFEATGISGQTLQVLDYWAESVILTLTVA